MPLKCHIGFWTGTEPAFFWQQCASSIPFFFILFFLAILELGDVVHRHPAALTLTSSIYLSALGFITGDNYSHRC